MEQASSSTPNDLNSPDEFTISIRSIHVKTTQLLVNKSWNIGQIKASVRKDSIEACNRRNHSHTF
jgi:hypothetical protein